MKVLGCKVKDEVYEKIKELGRPISDSLRDAIQDYIEKNNISPDVEVNHEETIVNQPQKENTEKNIFDDNKDVNRLKSNFKLNINSLNRTNRLSQYKNNLRQQDPLNRLKNNIINNIPLKFVQCLSCGYKFYVKKNYKTEIKICPNCKNRVYC